LLCTFVLSAPGGCAPADRLGPFCAPFDVSVTKTAENSYFRKYEITVRNEEPIEVSISSVLISYFIEPPDEPYCLHDYPVKVEALPTPEGNMGDVKLKPGESHAFRAVFPKLPYIEHNPNVNKEEIEIEVKAAAVSPDKRPYVIYSVHHSTVK